MGTTANPALTDAALTRDQAGHLTEGAIEDVRNAVAGYVGYLDACFRSPQPPWVVTAKQQAIADRARAEIMYLNAAAVAGAWAESGERPDLSSWAFWVGSLRDVAEAYSDGLATMKDPAYPHRRHLWSGAG